MKKFWFWLLLLGLFSLVGTTTHANDCKQIEFSNWGRVCVNIEKESSSNFQLETDIERGNGTLRCSILFSNNTYKEIAWCNDEFLVSNPKEQMIKLYIKLWSEFPSDREGKPSSKSEWLFPQWMYDFDEWEWSDWSSYDDDDDDDNNWDINDFQVTTDDSSPDTYQRVDLRIKARDDDGDTLTDYRGTVKFEIYYRTSSSSSWTKTTSSTYFELKSTYDNTYSFKSSDDGYATLYDVIRFNRDYEYKVKVIDDDSSSVYGERIFDVGDNNNDDNNWDINDFQVTTDDSSPDTYQRVDLRIKARDDDGDTLTDYRGTVKFEIYYRTSSSSSWTKTTSSTYFELKSTYDNTYSFKSSDDGYATLYDVIRFNRDYEYKVKVIDDDSSSVYGERIFDVGDNSSWIYGFTSTEINKIEKVYNIRDELISSLKRSSSRLRYNQTRIDLSEDLKLEMKRIIDNSSYKKYNTYKEFWTAFNNRYSHTLRNK